MSVQRPRIVLHAHMCNCACSCEGLGYAISLPGENTSQGTPFLRILIVEDQPIIAMALADAVEEMGGVAVGPAGTLREALDLASTGVFDAALLDVWLNGTSAYSVGDILSHRSIPFVVVSGAASSDQPLPYQRAPRLLKPFSNQEVSAALTSILQPNGCLPDDPSAGRGEAPLHGNQGADVTPLA